MTTYRIKVDVKNTFFIDLEAFEESDAIDQIELMTLGQIEQYSYTSDGFDVQVITATRLAEPGS